MKKLALFAFVLLTGCASTTVSVKQPWPDVPDELKETCTELRTVNDDTTKLSDVLIVVTHNYEQYKECKVKNDNWIEWYNTQKKIYESVK